MRFAMRRFRPSRRMGLVLVQAAALHAAPANVLYRQDFEGEVPQPRLHTNSTKYSIAFQGVTDEDRAAGASSYKIDATFTDGDYFYLMFPTPKLPLHGGLTVSARVLVTEGGHAGLGHNFLVPQSRPTEEGPIGGCTTWKLWTGPTSAWQSLVTDAAALRNQGEETCYGILTNPRFLGLSPELVAPYLQIEDPLYDAWYINVRFMKGRRVVLYVDDVAIRCERSAAELTARIAAAPARFEARRPVLEEQLEAALTAARNQARTVAAADAVALERLRAGLEQSRSQWEGEPATLHDWLGRAAAVSCFGTGVAALTHVRADGAGTTKRTDALVFGVQPILAPADLPDPAKPPAPALRRDRIEITMPPGTVDFGSLCVYANRDALPDVSIRVSPLTVRDKRAEKRDTALLEPLPEPWKFKPDPDDEGLANGWFTPDFNDADWAEIRTDLEQGWDGQGFEEQRIGYGWYRQRLAADPAAAVGRHRYLYFQAVDEDAYVYLDGKLIFEHTERTTGLTPNELWIRPFLVPLDDVWSGETDATLAVRVYNRKALGGIWKPVFLAAAEGPLTAAALERLVFARQTRPQYVPERRLDPDCVDPYVVPWWYRLNPDNKQGPPLFCGELLVKDPELVVPEPAERRNRLKYPSAQMQDAAELQPLPLAAGRGVQYFLIVRVPEQTPPGRYQGRIEVTSGAARIAELPLLVTVLPFALAEPLLDYTIYYRGGKLGVKPTEYAPVDSEYKTDEQIEADLADMLDHGVAHPIWYAAHDRILKMRRRFGIRGPAFMLYPNAPRPDQTQYIGWAANVIEALRQGGAQPIYIGGPDEPNVTQMGHARERIDATHRLLGVKVFTALCTQLSWENLRQHLDLAIVGIDDEFNRGRGIPPGKELVGRWHSDGKPVYSYGVYASFHANALGFRRYYGLQSWKTGCDGAAPYAYQHSGEDPWDTLAFACNFTWPTVNGRISTLQWEGFRAAVTDVRYISTLIHWLGKSAGPIPDHPARVAAERAVASLHAEGDLDEQRALVSRHILALQTAMAAWEPPGPAAADRDM